MQSTPRKAQIGLIRVRGGAAESIEAAQDELIELCTRCLDDGADVVFTPEVYQYRTARKTMPLPQLIAYAPRLKDKCSDLARRYNACVVPWDYEAAADGRIYNTSYVLDPTGNEVGRYRKTHITYSEVARGVSRGDQYPVFDLPFGKVGILICFDLNYPEAARILSLNGAELILVPLWGDTMARQWDLRLRSRAVDFGVHMASCCIDQAAYTGVVNPAGELLCRLDERGQTLVQEVELGRRLMSRTSGLKGQYEDLHRYLQRHRNAASYAPLMNPETQVAWAEVIPPASRQPVAQ